MPLPIPIYHWLSEVIEVVGLVELGKRNVMNYNLVGFMNTSSQLPNELIDFQLSGCSRCADVNVECRYGPKPKWIDDPKFGKIELER